MSARLEALHQVAPSLKARRTRSPSVVVATRERLAQRDPREQQQALSSTSQTGLGAEVFYDENLTVEEENEDLVSARSCLLLAILAAVSALLATAVMVAG